LLVRGFKQRDIALDNSYALDKERANPFSHEQQFLEYPGIDVITGRLVPGSKPQLERNQTLMDGQTILQAPAIQQDLTHTLDNRSLSLRLST
jgi:hypothetical protein